MCNIRISTMTILIVIPLIGSLQTSVSCSSTVHARKDGSTSTVIPFEGQEETIQDPIDDNFIRHFPKKKLCSDCAWVG